MDLLSEDSRADFKAHMKTFRAAQGEQEARFNFSGVAADESAVGGTIVLANATYEGEHCLQITVLTPQEALEGNTQYAMQNSDEGGLDLGSFLQLCEGVHEKDSTSFVFLFSMDGVDTIRSNHGLLGVEQATEPVAQLIQNSLDGVPLLRLSPGEFAAAFFNTSLDDATLVAEGLVKQASQLEIEVEAKTVHATLTAAGVHVTADVEHALDDAYQLLQENISQGAANTVVLEPQETEDAPELDEAGRLLGRINDAIER